MALQHFGDLLDSFGERVVVARVRDAHTDEGADVVAQRARVEACDVAADRAAGVELADAVGDGGLREAHRGRDLHLGGARVLLQEIQNPIIYRIEFHFAVYI